MLTPHHKKYLCIHLKLASFISHSSGTSYLLKWTVTASNAQCHVHLTNMLTSMEHFIQIFHNHTESIH